MHCHLYSVFFYKGRSVGIFSLGVLNNFFLFRFVSFFQLQYLLWFAVFFLFLAFLIGFAFWENARD